MNVRKDRKILKEAMERGVTTVAELAAYLRRIERGIPSILGEKSPEIQA